MDQNETIVINFVQHSKPPVYKRLEVDKIRVTRLIEIAQENFRGNQFSSFTVRNNKNVIAMTMYDSFTPQLIYVPDMNPAWPFGEEESGLPFEHFLQQARKFQQSKSGFPHFFELMTLSYRRGDGFRLSALP